MAAARAGIIRQHHQSQHGARISVSMAWQHQQHQRQQKRNYARALAKQNILRNARSARMASTSHQRSITRLFASAASASLRVAYHAA